MFQVWFGFVIMDQFTFYKMLAKQNHILYTFLLGAWLLLLNKIILKFIHVFLCISTIVYPLNRYTALTFIPKYVSFQTLFLPPFWGMRHWTFNKYSSLHSHKKIPLHGFYFTGKEAGFLCSSGFVSNYHSQRGEMSKDLYRHLYGGRGMEQSLLQTSQKEGKWSDGNGNNKTFPGKKINLMGDFHGWFL